MLPTKAALPKNFVIFLIFYPFSYFLYTYFHHFFVFSTYLKDINAMRQFVALHAFLGAGARGCPTTAGW